VKASALNTVEILKLSEIHNNNLSNGFEDVKEKLDDIQRTIIERPLSPLPPSLTVEDVDAPVYSTFLRARASPGG
jgi:hypothetical protein